MTNKLKFTILINFNEFKLLLVVIGQKYEDDHSHHRRL